MQKSKLKKEIEYGYYIDEDGLYFKSQKDGNTLECFDINGVASVTLNYSEIDILHLCYIPNENDELDDEF